MAAKAARDQRAFGRIAIMGDRAPGTQKPRGIAAG
jgi:hypothetical protein